MRGRREDPSRKPLPKLPAIAPRNDSGRSTTESTRGMAPGSGVVEVPKTRLPPRSRSGCWTCRQRKVKCDEERPTCRQCARLHHACDYGSRLSFRDDTLRVKERMHEVQTAGSSVWDPQAPSPDDNSDNSADDTLPPFAALTNDEEREAKAKSRDPGTYLVVANPGSFAGLPEYAENSPSSSFQSTGIFSGNENSFEAGGPRNIETSSPTNSHEDPNVIILRTFEDPSRRPSIAAASSSASPSPKPVIFSPITNTTQLQATLPYRASHLQSGGSTREQERSGGGEAHLIQHYRANISPHIVNVSGEGGGTDIFEQEARRFPPLFHAIMAISALSLAQRKLLPSTDAILHYGRVLTALQAEATVQSSSSDGAFYTHYLLLLYEISDAGPREDHLWQNHCNRLMQIIAQRQDSKWTEAHRYIVWTIFLINTYALLGGSDDGTYVQELIRNGMVPLPQESLYALSFGQPQTPFQDDLRYLPGIRELHQEILYLAIQVGQTARELRTERPQTSAGRHLQVRASEMQAHCRTMSTHWAQKFRRYWPQLPDSNRVDPKQLGFLYHAHALYRACVIFAHTSMYPGQMLENPYTSDISDSIFDILNMSQGVLADDRYEVSHLTFALFMAGYASLDPRQKSIALNMISALERKSYGNNTRIARNVLQGIYDKQRATISTTGYNLNVDWWAEIRGTGRGLVIFGL